jgi:hypothetical protein
MKRRTSVLVCGVLGVAAAAVIGPALATTLGETRTVPCIIDGTPLTVRTAKTRLTPALDRRVLRGRIEPLVTCPSCGWSGLTDDLAGKRIQPHEPTSDRRQSVHSWLVKAPVLTTDADRYERAATLHESLHPDEPHGHRWLMAAQVAGPKHPRYQALRRRARDSLLAVDTVAPLDAYAAAEISRQLGDWDLARVWFAVVVSAPGIADRYRRWSIESLEELVARPYGASMQKPL